MNFSLLAGSIDAHVSSKSRESLRDQRGSRLILEDQTRGTTIELIAEGDSSHERAEHFRIFKPGKYMITMFNWVQMNAEDSREVVHVNVTPDGDFSTVRLHERGVVRMRFRKSPLTDLNGDGAVNGKDLALLLGVWGTDGRGTDENGPYMADLDVDGKVDGKDLALLMGDWNV